MDCLFCKIVKGEIPATLVFEDDHAVAFRDINPQAPVHILVVPKKHIASLVEMESEKDTLLLGHLLALVQQIARSENLNTGYRTVLNTGPDAGQTVDHLHVHLLGGRALHWPPG